MLEFTISNAEPNPVWPWAIDQKGVRSFTPQKCIVNGIQMSPGDRKVFRGEISQRFPLCIYRNFAIEFRGQAPKFFSTVRSAWFEAAGMNDGDPVHWEMCVDWDGVDLTIFPEPEYCKGWDVVDV